MSSSFIRFVLLSSVIVVSSAIPAMADACTGPRFTFRFVNEAVDTDIDSTTQGCQLHFRSGGRTTFKSAEIVSTPRNGSLGRSGDFGFNYQPKKGFSGKDAFAVKICGQDASANGCSTIRFAVTTR